MFQQKPILAQEVPIPFTTGHYFISHFFILFYFFIFYFLFIFPPFSSLTFLTHSLFPYLHIVERPFFSHCLFYFLFSFFFFSPIFFPNFSLTLSLPLPAHDQPPIFIPQIFSYPLYNSPDHNQPIFLPHSHQILSSSLCTPTMPGDPIFPLFFSTLSLIFLSLHRRPRPTLPFFLIYLFIFIFGYLNTTSRRDPSHSLLKLG